MTVRRIDGAVLARVHFDEAPEPTPAAERLLVEEARTENRRLELRAGRAAARQAFEAAGLFPVPAVLPDASGRPVVDLPGWHVSLAHDARVAVAAVAADVVGLDVIDLSRAGDVARVVGARIASGRARPLCGRGLAGLGPAMLLWSAWEALGKRTGGGVLSGPMLLDIAPVPVDDGAVALLAGARVRWYRDSEVLVCLATSESP